MPELTAAQQAWIDRVVAQVIALSGRDHLPGWNGMVVTPDEIRAVLTEEVTRKEP